MNRRLLIIAAVICVLVLVPVFASADDLDDLKANDNKIREAWNNRDARQICEAYHDKAINVWPESVFSLDGKSDICDSVKNWFENTNETIQINPLKRTFHVAGDIGIVFGISEVTIKLKDGPRESRTERCTSALTKEGNKWLVVSHSCAIVSVGK